MNKSEKERVEGSELTWTHGLYCIMILTFGAFCFIQGMNWELNRENVRRRKELRMEVDQLLIEARKMDSIIKFHNSHSQ